MKQLATGQNIAPGRALAGTATGRKIDGQRDRERGVSPPKFVRLGYPSRVHYATEYKPGFRGLPAKVLVMGSSPIASSLGNGRKHLLGRALWRTAQLGLRARFFKFCETKRSFNYRMYN